MTPDDREQLRVAVAEAMGWERWKQADVNGVVRVRLCKPATDIQRSYWLSCGAELTTDPITYVSAQVPALTLDWLAECRKTLTEEHERRRYANELSMLAIGHWSSAGVAAKACFAYIDAPVELHAKAFLAAKGITHPTANRI